STSPCSCVIAYGVSRYSRSPAASRASPNSWKRQALTTAPSRIVQTQVPRACSSIPSRPETRLVNGVTTCPPASMNSSTPRSEGAPGAGELIEKASELTKVVDVPVDVDADRSRHVELEIWRKVFER